MAESSSSRASSSASSSTSMPPLHKVSKPLDVFEKNVDSAGKQKCLACGEPRQVRSNGSNAAQHLEKCPKFRSNFPEHYIKLFPKQNLAQPKVDQFLRSSKSEKVTKEEIDEQIVYYIAESNASFLTIEKPSFRKLIHHLNPNYVIPDRKTISNTLLTKVYDKIRLSLLPLLQEAKGYHITSDSWTSDAKDPYISCTVHFISNSYKLISIALATRRFRHPHTGERINEILNAILGEFQLAKDLWHYSVIDGGSNFQLGVRLGKSTSIHCAAHRLQLLIEKSLSDKHSKDLLAKITAISAYFKNSPKAKQLLEDEAKARGKLYLKMKLATPTRWSSTFEMLRRFNLMEDTISALVKNKDSGIAFAVAYPSVDDIIALQEIEAILQPLSKLTTTLCTDKFPSLGKELILWDGARKIISQLSVKMPIARSLQEALLNGLKSKVPAVLADSAKSRIPPLNFILQNHTLTALISAFLNPKFKDTLLSMISPSEQSSFFQALHIVLKHFNKIPQAPLVEEIVEAEGEFEIDGESVTPKPKKQKKQDDFEDMLYQGDLNEASELKEINVYQNLFIHVDERKKMDALEWWKQNSKSYPNLWSVAQIYLAIPATSTSSERVWSKAGLISSDLRSQISESKMDKLIFIDKNHEVAFPGMYKGFE